MALLNEIYFALKPALNSQDKAIFCGSGPTLHFGTAPSKPFALPSLYHVDGLALTEVRCEIESRQEEARSFSFLGGVLNELG